MDVLRLAIAAFAATASAATAMPFSFSTGDPDGKIATASRPGPISGANQATESADDFIVPDATTVSITQASFIGLVPSGKLMTISEVRVEVYRVFPMDSDVTRTSGAPLFSTTQVPTRVNSPSDTALDDLDSSTGALSFSASLVASSFTVNNSIDLGIHPKPNQTTGGDGAVTGGEVRIDVTFTPALVLAPGHYFFVPQVMLSTAADHFLWLSAPKPIVAPGVPFSPDLQTWIRNAALDPDWLRVGTDVVGSGTFNAAFSLAGEVVTPAPTQTPTATPTNTPRGPDGAACSAPSDCASDFCVAGVCCDTACDGPHEQCNVAGRSGTCNIPAAAAPALSMSALFAGSALLVGIAAVGLRRRSHASGLFERKTLP